MNESELLKRGFDTNPNLYIGDGYLYCNYCKTYRHHFAMSKIVNHIQHDVLVCKVCRFGIKG